MSVAKIIVPYAGPLQGDVSISGAKNAALPILAASLLTCEPMMFSNIPHLQDVTTMLNLLAQMGGRVTVFEDMRVEVINDGITDCIAPYELVRTMRASIVVLGPLLARYGEAKVSLPGGCAIGSRPVDLHLQALSQMGAVIDIQDGFINASVEGKLQGADIHFDKVTVTGTENVLMAAVLAEGETVLRNAAREPEVTDLVYCLQAMGAKITGAGTDTLVIQGVESLSGADYRIMPDRIEAGTYLAGAVITRGCVRVNDMNPDTLTAVLDQFKLAGASVTVGDDWVTVDMAGKRPQAVNIETAPYPAFPTDMQAQLLAINCVAEGEGTVTEHIFENRLMHAQELKRLGAQLEISQNRVRSIGVPVLKAAPIMATDLRASASLVLAAMVAKGEPPTVIDRIYHIDRGYERFEEKFRRLGVVIQRIH